MIATAVAYIINRVLEQEVGSSRQRDARGKLGGAHVAKRFSSRRSQNPKFEASTKQTTAPPSNVLTTCSSASAPKGLAAGERPTNPKLRALRDMHRSYGSAGSATSCSTHDEMSISTNWPASFAASTVTPSVYSHRSPLGNNISGNAIAAGCDLELSPATLGAAFHASTSSATVSIAQSFGGGGGAHIRPSVSFREDNVLERPTRTCNATTASTPASATAPDSERERPIASKGASCPASPPPAHFEV